jgi:RNA 2',3'-cyclic 3'-phosphodiesterase
MKKLFLGLSVDNKIQDEASASVKKMKTIFSRKEVDLRWSTPENWHITLLFLGAVSDADAAAMWSKATAVAQRTPAFDLKISGVGAFPDAREARVIWLGVQKSQKILDLQTDLENALGVASVENYIPHITVGRLRNLKSVWDEIKPFSKHKFGTTKVSELRLYESVMAGAHPIYNVIDKAQLRVEE